MKEIVQYKTLTEAVTHSGEIYYKSCTPEEFATLRAENESIYFDISKRYATSASISNWGESEQKTSVIESTIANLPPYLAEKVRKAIEKRKLDGIDTTEGNLKVMIETLS